MGSWSYAYFAVKDVLSDRLSFLEAVAGRGSRHPFQANLCDVSAGLASGTDAAYSFLAFSPIW